MKKLIIIGIIVSILMIIVFGFIIIGLILSKSNTSGVIEVGLPNSLSKEDGYVYKTKEELETDFRKFEQTKVNFNKYNYVLIGITYNSCSEENIRIRSYSVNNKTIKVDATYNVSCGFCANLKEYFLLEVDKTSIDEYEVELNYKALNKPHCNLTTEEKPIIYIYPKEDLNVTIKVSNPELLTTTYPRYYNNGWEVFAKSDGTLYDKKTKKEYYALYWEGTNKKSEIKKDGFVVERSNTSAFLEEKLKQLGLTDREINEFIIFWLPKLDKNKYNYVRFETRKEIDSYMKLDINPKPDTIIRVWMDYKPLDKMINVEEQILETPQREGSTVVEWGGSLIK